ncbi:MAG TPA: hypothetical protein VMU37_02815, partial [Caulobacteraceae bacterium]|nr:hypothetical protein [Caulobacteraceae bacterium]
MVARFILAGAERAPEKTAVSCNGRRLSYGEFARAIEAMIQRFESAGVAGSGYAVVAVGDLLEHWVISLALRELGLATIPIRDVETAQHLPLTSVRFVVAGLEENWSGIEAVCQRRGWRLVKTRWAGAMARPAEAGRQRVAEIGEQVLQTSATTGRHKFVLERRAMEPAVMAFVRRVYRFDEDSRVAHFNLGAWTAVGYRMTASAWFSGGEVLMQHTQHLHRPLEENGLTHGLLLPSLA